MLAPRFSRGGGTLRPLKSTDSRILMLKAAQIKVKKVRKISGEIVDFEGAKIINAVNKAIVAVEGKEDISRSEKISDRVILMLNEKFGNKIVPSVEDIQDLVEESLIKAGLTKVAKAYILYRSKRAEVRESRKFIPESIKDLSDESKKYFKNDLAEFIYYRTYSRWIEEEGRRETWIETVSRYIDFMRENLGSNLEDKEYDELRNAILNQEVVPSMRLMWGSGKAARKNNVSAYNCSYIAPSKLQDFSEIMYLSMCGTGVGFSVESQTVQRLPIIKHQTGKILSTHAIEDSKEGWGNALTIGLKAWYGGKDINFDYSKVRPAGARLRTMGGQSSGPEPLRALLDFSRKKILSKQGKRLSNLDVHDIICKIGEVVVMGGVRRSALLSLSDFDDEEMRHAKDGQFYFFEPQRQMSNNSVAYNRKPTTSEFMEEWVALAKSGTGERGIFNRAGLQKQLPERRWKVFKKYWQTSGTNPCITGDTLVYVADGRGHMPIKQLAKEGKDVPVFCLDNRGKVAVRYMRNPRITGKDREVYKIILDDGSVVKATADHKFRLKSGEYKEIKNLSYGDSLHVLTKHASPVGPHKRRTQDYWWVNNGVFASNSAEHRLIASFHYNKDIPNGYVVHHKDKNAQNNDPLNLEILSKEDHDELHARLMIGDLNPMRRAGSEWSDKKWAQYKLKHSKNNEGDKNSNFSGFTDEELKNHVLQLTKNLGYRFSYKDWADYARGNGLPQCFSKWRKDHLGGIMGLAKWAAQELGLDNINADPRVAKSYKKYTSQGYNCVINDGKLRIVKNCEVCGGEFKTRVFYREYGACSISCGLKQKWSDKEHKTRMLELIHTAHYKRKEVLREKQAQVYSDLKFGLRRDPFKKEWMKECKENNVSNEISRLSSPFRKYVNLKEFADMYNHKVVSVESCGREDVYNGTVDEFHNFFVGGFEGKTKKNKRKFVYLNNLNCGEIVLRSKQFCNLSEVICRFNDTKETLLQKIRLATILGTYQSTLTNFPYLSKEWKENCEEERLLGVSLTGQWDCPAVRDPKVLNALREESFNVNKKYAKKFGINASTCITCVKPSGTVSQLVDASSGMHPRHAKYYIRRVRISANDPLFHMLRDQKFPYYPEVGQLKHSASTYVLEFPIKAPKVAITRDSISSINQLEHWKLVKENYTEHNPSVTVSVGDNEWIEAANWLYGNWDMLGGLSFLPRTDHSYALAPYEEISKEKYDELYAKMPKIDFAQILLYEKEDTTQGAKELACVAGVCEIEEVTAVSTDATGQAKVAAETA